MTVKELIEALQMYDGSMPVYYWESGEEYCDHIEIGIVKVEKLRKVPVSYVTSMGLKEGFDVESAMGGKPFFCGVILEEAEDE